MTSAFTIIKSVLRRWIPGRRRDAEPDSDAATRALAARMLDDEEAMPTGLDPETIAAARRIARALAERDLR